MSTRTGADERGRDYGGRPHDAAAGLHAIVAGRSGTLIRARFLERFWILARASGKFNFIRVRGRISDIESLSGNIMQDCIAFGA